MTETATLPARKGVSNPARRDEADPVQVYRQRFPFHCSAECGEPIRWGQEYVQTSPDWHPLTRAHKACAEASE